MTISENQRDLELWNDLIQARAFDQAMCDQNPHWHEARGEEAVIVGGFSRLEESDVVAPHFRGACAVALLRGATPQQLAANVFGSRLSASGGTWRGDICPTPNQRFIGMFSGSLGTSVAYATGAAIHLQRQQPGAVAVCAFGDGTANSGIVYESLNMAAMFKLPIVFICQNNQYATSLASSEAIAGNDVSARARACGIPAEDVDGNCIHQVVGARERAVERAREGAGPSFIHAETYRLGGHYMSDPELYRSSEEVELWEARDPVRRSQEDLIERGLLTQERAQEQLDDAAAEMIRVVTEAKSEPEADHLTTSAYAEDLGWVA